MPPVYGPRLGQTTVLPALVSRPQRYGPAVHGAPVPHRRPLGTPASSLLGRRASTPAAPCPGHPRGLRAQAEPDPDRSRHRQPAPRRPALPGTPPQPGRGAPVAPNSQSMEPARTPPARPRPPHACSEVSGVSSPLRSTSARTSQAVSPSHPGASPRPPEPTSSHLLQLFKSQ